jgi:hypothetical protein
MTMFRRLAPPAPCGDIVAFCPPPIINEAEIDEVWRGSRDALDKASAQLAGA